MKEIANWIYIFMQNTYQYTWAKNNSLQLIKKTQRSFQVFSLMFWREYWINDHNVDYPNSYIDRSFWKIIKYKVISIILPITCKSVAVNICMHSTSGIYLVSKYYNPYRKSNTLLLLILLLAYVENQPLKNMTLSRH